MKQNKKRGSFLGLGSGLFWGLDSVVIGIALNSVVMMTLGFSATLASTAIHDGTSFISLMGSIISKKKVKEFKKVLFSKSGIAIIIAALLGGPIGMGAYIISISYLGASMASSISAIYPAIGAALAYVFLKEKLKKHSLFGLLLAIVAIALMGVSGFDKIDNMALGVLAISVCVVGWGSEAVIISATLSEDVSSDIALAIRQLTSSIFYLLIILPFIGLAPFLSVFNNPKILLLVMAAGLVGTISYMLYYESISIIGATQAMGLNISYPAWTFLFQFMYDRQFDFVIFILVIFVMIGSIMSNENPKEFFTIFKKTGNI